MKMRLEWREDGSDNYSWPYSLGKAPEGSIYSGEERFVQYILTQYGDLDKFIIKEELTPGGVSLDGEDILPLELAKLKCEEYLNDHLTANHSDGKENSVQLSDERVTRDPLLGVCTTCQQQEIEVRLGISISDSDERVRTDQSDSEDYVLTDHQDQLGDYCEGSGSNPQIIYRKSELVESGIETLSTVKK